MEEVWYPVPRWEGVYEVTKTGRVRSLDRLIETSRGHMRRKRGVELKTTRPGNRYPMVDLWGNGRRENTLLHRILAEAFIPNPDNLPYVRHLNDDPLDYRLENLAWGTQYENLHDLYTREGHYNSHKTHCKRGHAFDEKNTYRRKDGGRTCRTCRDSAVRKHYENRRKK